MTTHVAVNAGAPMGAALHEAKLAARARTMAARDALAPEVRAAAAAKIAATLIALPSFTAATTVLLTLPFRGEWDTLPVVRAAIDAGKTVALPRVDTVARMLVLHAVTDLAHDIAPGYAGILEPVDGCPIVPPQSIDWVLVPGVAFDASGRRLGYGGGFYDRLLPLMAAHTACVAGAFDIQVIERVPAAPHDRAIGTIVTETRILAPIPDEASA